MAPGDLTLPMMTGGNPAGPAPSPGRRPRRRVAGVAVALALGAGVLQRTVHRVEVVGWSMAPILVPGDRLVVVGVPWSPPPWPAPGRVVALRDPREPRRILVKRVVAIDRPNGTLTVEGDRPGASTDSRTFGPVPRSSLVGRVVYRYAPPGRRGALPRPGEYDRA